MGILGAAAQLFNTARKAPIAGKFLRQAGNAFRGSKSQVDDVLRGTPLGNNPVVRAGRPPATSLDSVRASGRITDASKTGSVIPGASARYATQGVGGDPFGASTPFVRGATRTPVTFPPNPNVGTQLIQRGSAASTKLAGTGGVGNTLLNTLAPGQSLLGRGFGALGRAGSALGVVEAGKRLVKGDIPGALMAGAGSFPGRTLGLASNVLRGTGAAAIAKPLIGATALIALTPGSGGDSSMDDYYKTLTPAQKKKFEADTRSQQENMSDAEKRRMGITPADPLVTRLPADETLTPPTIIEDPVLSSPSNLPSSPEAVVANPLQQKMAEYEQGRAKATTQEEMNAVRDLGMSIHQAANPQMYEESYNPLMAATFPERYTKTPEDFVVQGGIQAPRSMTEKDAAQATAFGNKVQNIENLDVNPMYNPFEASDEQSRLDKALAAVIASRRFNQ